MMDNYLLFKSVLQQDRAPIVLCDLSHKIVYMNPAAVKNYEKYGGEKLLGQSLLDCHSEKSRNMILKTVEWFKKDKNNNLVYTFKNVKLNKDIYMVALRDDEGELIGYYEKHEFRTDETMKKYDID